MKKIETSVSIIIPTFNEEKYIEKCLNHITTSKFNLETVEILVIDGGSKDKTISLIDPFSSKIKIKVFIIDGCTVYQALNRGLKEASGKYIVRVDARAFIPQNYIKRCLEHLHNPRIGSVGGVQTQFGQCDKSNLISEVLQLKIGNGGAKFRSINKNGYVDSVYLGAFKKELLEQLGGFDEDGLFVSEDSIINDKIRRRGLKVLLDNSLLVFYPAKNSAQALFKQYFIYGAAKAHMFKKYKRLTKLRQMIPLLFFIGWIFGIATIPFFENSINILTLAMAAYIFLLTLVILTYSKSNSPAKILFKLLTLLCIHFGWPLGFITNLLSDKLTKRITTKL